MSKGLIIAAAVAACVVLIALAVAPNFVRPHVRPRDPCINILRRIDAATETWAREMGKTTNDAPAWDELRPYLSRDGKIPKCPEGGTYTLGRRGTPPTCSYPGHRLQ